MALSNFGGDVGSYLGVGLMEFFKVSRHDYTNLPTLVLIKALTRLIPIALIPFLVPDASPMDEILTPSEREMTPRPRDLAEADKRDPFGAPSEFVDEEEDERL
jgi:hypothetical protein